MAENAGRERPESYLHLGEKIGALRSRNVCYQCQNLATGEVFPDEPVIYDDARIRVVLDEHPKARGHTIVVWKPHRADFTELDADETAALFTACTGVANAIKRGLGAEKVYLVTMCDGGINHLHIQLLPRYPGELHGSKRFTASRHPLTDGDEIAAAIRAELAL